MTGRINQTSFQRRRFLRRCGGAGAVLALADFDFLGRLPHVSAAETKVHPDAVQFSGDIEPLVRLLEETPRSKVIQVFADKIRSGTSYREVLAALLLAGVRNVEPRPSVGFKFHAVLVVNSAHLASLASPDTDRWLPIFWALDYFKSSQARDVQEGNWTMAPVDESAVPPPHRARQAFIEAMDRWDVDAADVAVAGLARSAGANEVFELMAHYGCRDFRSIGHKAIFVANGFRTLQCIGWRYAEPVLRSLAYAILNHNGEPNPADSDLAADRAVRVTEKEVENFGKDWNSGRVDQAATWDQLAALRSASPEDAVRQTAELIRSGIHPQSVSDALFLSAGEMVMQQPGIVALHSATSTNAMQYAFRHATNDSTRLRLLLQNAAFIPYFRDAMRGRGSVGETRIDQLGDESQSAESATVDGIFADAGKNRTRAASSTLSYLESQGRAEDVIHAARELVFLKGNDSHDYKYSSAALEDYYAISEPLRNRYLAAATYLLPGTGDQDNGLVNRVREAFA